MKSMPRCKMCRREGKKLFLKGSRCLSPKCALNRKKYPPGANGPKGYSRLSEYGLQLRAKQRLKRFYGVLEKQCRNYFSSAKDKKGNTEINFLRLFETRIDNIVCKAGFSSSHRAARQLISHGNILLNDKRLDIPSYQVRVGDVIKVKNKKNIKTIVENNLTISENKNKDFSPIWFDIDSKNLQIKILQEPNEKDLSNTFDSKLIIAFYSR